MTQHRQQDTRVTAKGIDPMWIRFSLLCYNKKPILIGYLEPRAVLEPITKGRNNSSL